MANKPEIEAIFYFDACVLIDLIENPVEQEPSKTIAAILEDAEKGRFRVITSVITMTEVLYAESERHNNKLDPDIQARINELWHPTSPIQIVEVNELIARESQKTFRTFLDSNGWAKSKGNDLIHLITAKREGVTHFLSKREQAMKKWGPIFNFEICEPFYNSPVEEDGKNKEEQLF